MKSGSSFSLLFVSVICFFFFVAVAAVEVEPKDDLELIDPSFRVLRDHHEDETDHHDEDETDHHEDETDHHEDDHDHDHEDETDHHEDDHDSDHDHEDDHDSDHDHEDDHDHESDHDHDDDHDDHGDDHDDHGDDHDHDDHGDDHDHDDHGHDDRPGMNYTINGEEVSSPGVYEIMERYDENEDGYLSPQEFDEFFEQLMEMAAGGEAEGHEGHNHKKALKRSNRIYSALERGQLGASGAVELVGVVMGGRGGRLGVRSDHDHDHDDHEDCMGSEEMFEEHDLDEDGYLNSVEVLLVCPDLVIQILNGCAAEDEHNEDCDPISTSDAWLYGMLSVFGISMLSVIGIFLIPIHNEKVRKFLIQSLVAFAVGALFGDVILHLIPHALGIHAHGEILDDVGNGRVTRDLWLMLVTCAGFMLFMVLELSIRGVKGLVGVTDEDEMEAEQVDKPKKSRSLARKLTGFDEEKKRYRDIKAVGYLNLASDGLHNFIDGITLGIAWTDSVDLGVATTIAIIAHEIPQELGDFGILVHAGFTKWQALMWNLISASLAILGAIIGLAVGTSADKATPWLLALAAGNFLYISLVSMMPEVLKGIKDVKSGVAAVFLVSLGISVLFIIAVFEDEDC